MDCELFPSEETTVTSREECSEYVPPEECPEDVPREECPEDVPREECPEDVPLEECPEDVPREECPEDVPREECPEDVPREECPEDVPREECPEDVPREECPEDVPREENNTNTVSNAPHIVGIYQNTTSDADASGKNPMKAIFQCPLCLKKYSTKTNLNRHHAQIHCTPSIPCSMCQMRFATPHQLRVHTESTHMGIRFNCSYTNCNKSYKAKSTLTAHIQQIHTGSGSYICHFCGIRSNSKWNLEGHLNKHMGIKPHSCQKCQKTFTYQGDLKRHTTTCGVGPIYPCGVCAKLFKSRRYLDAHMNNHSRPTKHMCTICGKSYIHRGSLHNHTKLKHQ